MIQNFLMMDEALTILFNILAFLTLIISICIKDRKKSLGVQSLSCLFEAAYDFMIGAFTGASLNVINFIRSRLFINKDKFHKKIYFMMLVIFETLIIINCTFTWSGPISFLPTIGSIIRTYCLWQTNMKYVRISGLTTATSYGLYYIYYEGWFMVLGYSILLMISVLAIYNNDFRNRRGNLKRSQ